jgi:catechol 2,3-dioxygenase-like lactoylglutathione lyase family enzyme
MPVDRIDHVNIRTSDIAATAAFFRDVLGLRVADSPRLDPARFQWVYAADGAAMVHITIDPAAPPSGTAGPTGGLDHAAFVCSDLPAMRARLDSLGTEYRVLERGDGTLTQLFLTEPNGVLLELNFPA